MLKRCCFCADVRLYWHPQGDYLAVQVDRFTKTRKSTFTAFELFSVKERDIPMEVGSPPPIAASDPLLLCAASGPWSVSSCWKTPLEQNYPTFARARHICGRAQR